MSGIPDWKKKLAVIRDLLGAMTHREIFVCVLPNVSVDDIAKLADASRRWGVRKPQRAEFFHTLARKLDCPPPANGLVIINGDIKEFVAMLPESSRETARRIADIPSDEPPPAPQPPPPLSPPPGATNEIADDRIVYLCQPGTSHSFASGVRAGVIDTRCYYSTADAAEGWAEIVSADSYPTYDECKYALKDLMTDVRWLDVLREYQPTTAIMLAGGGAPTKDLVLLRALLDVSDASKAKITMMIVDINFYMIAQTATHLRRTKKTLKGHERVAFRFVCGDVLNLGELGVAASPVFDRKGSVVFAITGNTVGNLSEQTLFHSLDTIAQRGDLLIVGTGILDGMSNEQISTDLLGKYDTHDMRRFVTPGVTAVIEELRLSEPLSEAIGRINVQAHSNAERKFSDVPNSWSASLTLSVKEREKERDIVLLVSCKYVSSSLIEFAKRYGWESICVVPSPHNAQYAQLAFRRM